MRFLSVCSGIEAASVAWHPLGWQAVALSEIEPFPSAVLAHHYPDVPNWGDMTRFEEWPDADVDVLVGGTPCQDYSVAGLRLGMAGSRGQLTLTFVEVAARYRPCYIVWENVPGVLSSNGGRDFARFLGDISGQTIPVHEGGWQNSGIIPEGTQDAYGLAYRVLDAQFVRVDGLERAVPQRRRRVFVVGCLGDWRRAAAVLFERESLCGHPAPSRKAGESVAPTIAGCANGSGANGPGRDVDSVESLIPERERALTTSNQRIDAETETLLVTHALTGEGFDASEDGTGRGTPLVPIAFGWQNSSAQGASASEHHSPTLDKSKVPGVGVGMQVRRLTPRECARLQGFQDDYLDITFRGRQATDSAKYKALGNSMAVNCMRWIGARIQMVNAIERARAAA